MFVFITGFRFAPVISTVDEEVESQHLRFLAVPPGRTAFDILNQIDLKSVFILLICLSICPSVSPFYLSAHLPSVPPSVCLSVWLDCHT